MSDNIPLSKAQQENDRQSQMITKILVANRGEIACRVMRTAKKLGIRTVAIYSVADAKAMHVKIADEAYCVGPSPSGESYLKANNIIDIAIAHQVDAIHPGYGFLSENADFARLCEQNAIIFIGPKVPSIVAMGSKSAAKQIMQDAGVPLVPGYHGDNQSAEFLKQESIKMGFPVLLKAAAGGGGKGMREVWKEQDFDAALTAAKREAMAGFNDDIMLVEKFLTQPRHVEIQVFCDNHGNGVYLFERDCSIQRRHQKVIEEAPAPRLPEGIRDKMGEAALKAAFAIDYSGAGTVEFLLDVDGSFYFMEMNTRLQVEHPVTEMITGEDLVEWQIMVANDQVLPKKQHELRLQGHAMEARIYAEDPSNEFLPSTGTLSLLCPPAQSEHVRVDTGVVQGDEVSIYYDPMIAKLIVWGKTREQALLRLTNSLENYAVGGVATNISYLINIAKSSAFKQANLCTQFIQKNQASISTQAATFKASYLPMAVLAYLLNRQNYMPIGRKNSWAVGDSFRLNTQRHETIQFVVDEKTVAVEVAPVKQSSNKQKHTDAWLLKASDFIGNQNDILISGELFEQSLQSSIGGTQSTNSVLVTDKLISLYTADNIQSVAVVPYDLGDMEDDSGSHGLEAPMNGTVVEISVTQGQIVKKGDTVAIVEAMKMEHAIKAPYDAEVLQCFFKQGDLVSGGAALLSLEAISVENLNVAIEGK